MSTYSFLDVSLSISGPNIATTLGGEGTGSAEEGFTPIFEEDVDIMTQGADGDVMHSMTAALRGRIELHLLKTSPVNSLLSSAFANDRGNGSLNWARNTVRIRNPVSGDTYTCIECAIRKPADNAYAMRGNTLTWVINSSKMDARLGALTVGAP